MTVQSLPSDRLKGAAGALLVQGVLLWALIAGLAGPALTRAVRDNPLLSVFVTPPPVPPKLHEVAPRERVKEREGAAAPPNLKSTATELVAPKPILPPPPQPMAVAPVANTGVQSTQGAAPVAGPGTGAGGEGNGFGAGGNGDGEGGGGGGGTPPKQIGGRIKGSDLPTDLASLVEDGVDRVVGVSYAIEEDGRVDDCRITRSSGNRELDIRTCELIEQKFRYRPALDEDRQPVKSYIVENHTWNFQDIRSKRR